MVPALHLQEDFGAWLLAQMGHEDQVDVTDEAASKIANRVLQAVNETNLEERRRKIIGYAESDPDVTSIGVDFQPRPEGPVTRSEEHTSELQSLMRISYAVFCLKKKNKEKTKL